MGRGVGLKIGVGVRVAVGVGVIVLVGVIVGLGGLGVLVEVAVADGLGVSDGVKVGVAVGNDVAVWTGSAVWVAVAVLGSAAGILGRAVKVGVGLGVGLATVGETLETRGGVGLAQQPTMVLEMMTNSTNAVNAGILRLFFWVDCDERSIVLFTRITFLCKSCQRCFRPDRRWRSAR